MSEKIEKLKKDFENLKMEFDEKIEKIDSLHYLTHDFKSLFLGKESLATNALKEFVNSPGEEKKLVFPVLNWFKDYFEKEIKKKSQTLEDRLLNEKLLSEKMDFTIPVFKSKFNSEEHYCDFYQNQGSLHPVSFAFKKIAEIFKKYNFEINDSFEIEDDFHNFTGLNVKRFHPARQMQDTFYLDNKIKNEDENEEFSLNLFNKTLLRTHTTSVTLRYCKDKNPPIRSCSMGKVFRVDSDRTHSPMFHQLEVVVIDKGLSVVDLRFYIERLLVEFFEIEEKDLKIRFRPSYFPFTSPSFEVDIGYDVIDNKIVLGRGERYLEILGSGILHQNVLKAMNIDHEKYSSIAFGCGIERILMLKYGMNDIRSFYQGDLNWLKNYNFKEGIFEL